MKKYGKKLNKILFLDIDGVLNGYDLFQRKAPYPLSEFNEEKIELLNSLIDDIPDIKIVLSSSWRAVEGIDNIFKAAGLKKELFSKTPFSNKNRGYEIDKWLSSFNEEFLYCIVDDIDDFDSHQKQYLVQTNPNFGLTKKDVEKIKKILNG